MSAVAIRDLSWQSRGACIGSAGAHDFYSDEPNAIRRAKIVCAGCPVRAECEAYARANHEPAGVWGGLTPEERGIRVSTRPTCFSCGGTLVPISETRDRCASCGSTWYA